MRTRFLSLGLVLLGALCAEGALAQATPSPGPGISTADIRGGAPRYARAPRPAPAPLRTPLALSPNVLQRGTHPGISADDGAQRPIPRPGLSGIFGLGGGGGHMLQSPNMMIGF